MVMVKKIPKFNQVRQFCSDQEHNVRCSKLKCKCDLCAIWTAVHLYIFRFLFFGALNPRGCQIVPPDIWSMFACNRQDAIWEPQVRRHANLMECQLWEWHARSELGPTWSICKCLQFTPLYIIEWNHDKLLQMRVLIFIVTFLLLSSSGRLITHNRFCWINTKTMQHFKKCQISTISQTKHHVGTACKFIRPGQTRGRDSTRVDDYKYWGQTRTKVRQ